MKTPCLFPGMTNVSKLPLVKSVKHKNCKLDIIFLGIIKSEVFHYFAKIFVTTTEKVYYSRKQ